MFDADSNNPAPNTQDWGHRNHWGSNNQAFLTDQKRALYSDGTINPQRPYYMFMNHCPQQEAIVPNPGVESWSHPGMLPPALASSNSPICSRRNADSFWQNVHSMPRHLLIGGGAYPLSEGGPPSLPPSVLFPHPPERSNRIQIRYPWESTPSFCPTPTLRQRSGIDTPPRFSSGSNTIYPPTSMQPNDYTSMPISTFPYHSASTNGILSNSIRNQSNMPSGSQIPESVNYTDHGCYSLPVTTTAFDHQNKPNQRCRPFNVLNTQLAKKNGPINENASKSVKEGMHRRTLSDPGPFSLEDVIPSNPPPPPPPLRIDNWMKGRLRNARIGVESSIMQGDTQWNEDNEERKVHQNKEVNVIRCNESSENESEILGIPVKPLKASGNAHVSNKNGCCCSCWSSQKKVLEEMLALKEANRKICREMKEIRKEIDDLRMIIPSPALGKQSNGFLGWQYTGVDYNPGMISELVEEVREAAHLREEAFLAHVHSSIIGSSCGCGQVLDGSADDLKKSNCWWWNLSRKTSNNNCFPPKSVPPSRNKLSMDTTEIENLKEMVQELQIEKNQTTSRLKMLEEELNKYKLGNETLAVQSTSYQENESNVEEKEDKKSSKDRSCRQCFDSCKNEEPINQEIVLLRNEVQKLRMQLQSTLTAKDTIAQDQKIEQLTTLLQKVLYPAKGLSLSGCDSYPAHNFNPPNIQEVPDKLEENDENQSSIKLRANEESVEELIQSMSFAKSGGGGNEEFSAENCSPPNSLESNCSSSSSSSQLNFSSCHPPVTIHGPVTDL